MFIVDLQTAINFQKTMSLLNSIYNWCLEILTHIQHFLFLKSQVVGKEHLPEYRDRNNFPYTMAMVQETIRLKTVGM